MKDFDDIVIGGSPSMIARGVHRAAAGRKVAVLEAHPELGGSWRLLAPFRDGRRYDCFEHYLAGGPAAQQLLAELGVPLVPRPLHYFFPTGLSEEETRLVKELYQPDEDVGGKMLPATEGSFVTRHRRGAFTPEALDQLRFSLSKKRWRDIRRAKDATQFFRTNVDDLMGPLLEAAGHHGVTMLTGHKVQHVRSDAEGVTVEGDFGQLRAERCLVGRHFEGRLVHGGEEIAFPRVPDQRNTLLFRVLSERPQPYGYVKLGNWRKIRGLQRISVDEPEGRTAFGLYVGSDVVKDETAFLALLVETGILQPDSILVDHHWLNHHFGSGVSAIADDLPERSGGRIEALCFTSFGRDIAFNPEIWRTALTGRPRVEPAAPPVLHASVQ